MISYSLSLSNPHKMDKLVELPIEQLPILRDISNKDPSKYQFGYAVLQNYVKWLEKAINLPNFKCYTLNGDYSDGTFVIINSHHIYVNTTSQNLNRLTTALSLINWNKDYAIFCPERIRPAIQKHIKANCIKVEYDFELLWYAISPELGTKIEIKIPEGFNVRSLSERDIFEVNSLWPFKYKHSEEWLKRIGKYNVNVGVFTNSGELAGWCLRFEMGGLAALQLKDSYIGLGLGKLMVKIMTKLISEMGEFPAAMVRASNEISNGIFKSVGYEVIDNMYLLRTFASSSIDGSC